MYNFLEPLLRTLIQNACKFCSALQFSQKPLLNIYHKTHISSSTLLKVPKCFHWNAIKEPLCVPQRTFERIVLNNIIIIIKEITDSLWNYNKQTWFLRAKTIRVAIAQ